MQIVIINSTVLLQSGVNYIVLSTTDMLIIGDWWSVIILGDRLVHRWKGSEFLVIGELTNYILVIGESWGYILPPPPPPIYTGCLKWEVSEIYSLAFHFWWGMRNFWNIWHGTGDRLMVVEQQGNSGKILVGFPAFPRVILFTPYLSASPHEPSEACHRSLYTSSERADFLHWLLWEKRLFEIKHK